MDEISTNYLYHHTYLPQLKSILQARGFWYTQQLEKVPYKRLAFKQENFVVCFCDLPLHNSKHVRKRFGPVSIGLTKEWGFRRGVSPVTYIHSESPGLDDTYILLKNLFRLGERVQEYHFDDSRIQLIQGATLRVYSDKNEKGESLIPGSMAIEHADLEMYAKELKAIVDDQSIESNRVAAHTFAALMWCIRLLHNHLETRDSYLRQHEDISETGERIPVYDEREWRAAFQFGMDPELQIDRSGVKPRLKDEYNLIFEDSDIAEIVVRSDDDRIDIETFLKEIGRPEIISRIVIIPFD